MEGGLLLDVVITQSAAVLELFSGEDQPLLVRRDALLVLDFLFDVVDRVARLDVQRDGLAREGLDEDLRARARRRRGVRGARFWGERRGDGVGRVRSRAPCGDSVEGLRSAGDLGCGLEPKSLCGAADAPTRVLLGCADAGSATCIFTEPLRDR